MATQTERNQRELVSKQEQTNRQLQALRDEASAAASAAAWYTGRTIAERDHALETVLDFDERLKKLAATIDAYPQQAYAGLLVVKRDFAATGITSRSVQDYNDKLRIRQLQDAINDSLAIATLKATRAEISEFERRLRDLRAGIDTNPKRSYEALLALLRDFDATGIKSRPIQEDNDVEAVKELERSINYFLLDAKVKMTRAEVKGFEQRLQDLAARIDADSQHSYVALLALKGEFDATDIASRSIPGRDDKIAIMKLQDAINNTLAIAKNKMTGTEIKEFEDCLWYEEEMPLLKQALKFEEDREGLSRIESEIALLITPRPQWANSALWIIGIAAGLALLIGIVTSSVPLLALSFVLPFAALIVYITTSERVEDKDRVDRLDRMRVNLRNRLAVDHNRERIEEVFGQHTAAEYAEMMKERKALIAKVRG